MTDKTNAHPRTEVQMKEYEAAQEMLKHYDSQNWQIGSILTAAAFLMTGFVLDSERIGKLVTEGEAIGKTLVFALPFLTFLVMLTWLLWFRRHREYYNFRNETLHRLEVQLGMYHYLRVVQAVEERKRNSDKETLERLKVYAKNAGYGEPPSNFRPFKRFEKLQLSGPPGHWLPPILSFGLPFFQFVVLWTMDGSMPLFVFFIFPTAQAALIWRLTPRRVIAALKATGLIRKRQSQLPEPQ